MKTNENFSEGSLINRDDCALVIVDIQEKLIPAIEESEPMIENVVRLIQFSKIVSLPVVTTEQIKLGDTINSIKEEIQNPRPITKSSFNCFCSEDFMERVEELDRSTLILVGIEAHICVAQTALGSPSGYRIQVVRDAVSSRDIEDRKVALNRIDRSGGTITTTEMLIYELLERANTEEFKRVLPLVK
ncbi:MAG: isochorismatase family protein [Candidatus Bipolaricaulota bacterium]